MSEGAPRPRVAAAVFEVVPDGPPPALKGVHAAVLQPLSGTDYRHHSPGPAGNRWPAPLALALSHEDPTRIFLLRKHAQHRELLGLNIDKWIAYRALAQVVGMFIP